MDGLPLNLKLVAQAKTFANEISFSGAGVHGNEHGFVRLIPAQKPEGIWFVNSRGHKMPLSPQYLIPAQGHTALSDGTLTVKVVEHLLAAMGAAGIYHGLIELSQNETEVPILGGNALSFWESIQKVGTKSFDAPQEVLRLSRTVEVKDGQRHLLVEPADHFSVRVAVQFDQLLLDQKGNAQKEQLADFKNGDDFASELAGARTWGFMREWEKLQTKGLGMGANIENAIGIYADGSTTSPLKWPNELARHKLLDLLGDLMVLGMPLLAKIIAIRPGHAINAELVKKIYEAISFVSA